MSYQYLKGLKADVRSWVNKWFAASQYMLVALILASSSTGIATSRLPRTLQEEVNRCNLIFVGKVVEVEQVRVAGLDLSKVLYSIDELLLDQEGIIPPNEKNLELHLLTFFAGATKPAPGETALWMLNTARSFKGHDILVAGGEEFPFRRVEGKGRPKVFSYGKPVGDNSRDQVVFTNDPSRAMQSDRFTAHIKRLIQNKN
jgi:hypothetical protein